MPRPSSSSFEAAVRGATKVKLASPKAKYCQQILLATQSGDAGVAEVFRTLTHRLRDSTWTVAFKALIIVHLMIKEGAQDVTLRYLAVAPRNRLAINSFTDVQTQGQNIRVYSEYLLSRAMGFERTKCDHVRSGEGRMKRSSVDKGLLRETEAVQDQIKALVKCDLLNHDTENEISLTAFRLLTRDLLDLYNVENEAVMNVLSRYFEMSRPDAERAIRIYKVFCKQTEQVVAYLSVARQYEYATRLEIPKLKHAPTSLAASLQEYLDDKDFEINRRQYLAEQEAKKDGKSFPKKAQSQSQLKSAPASTPFDARPATATTTSQPAKGPAPDLIDFFASIDQQQTPMGTNTNPFLRQQQSLPQMPSQMTGYQQPQQPFGIQPQMTGFEGSQNYQFNQPQQQQQQAPQPLQSQSIGAGFGGYGPQPTQQQQQPFPTGNAFGQDQSQALGSPAQAQPPAQLQPQTTNPFRLSMMQTGGNFASGFNQPQLQQQRTGGQSSNPFARSALPPVIHENEPTSPFAVQPSYQPQPLQPQTTGTNPFARNKTPTQQTAPSATAPAPLQLQATGSTNPFRQSMFVNQQTGQGWQYAPQATMGGLEQLPTMPVFPRPVQAPAQPQQQQQQSWL